MSKVGIIAVGQSAFVRSYPGSIRELAFEAYAEAMRDADLEPGDIQASVICSAPEYDRQRSPAGVLAEYFGLNPQPTFYAETLCSSSSTGLKLAYSLVKSGLHDCVLVAGFQKMSEISSAESQERMGRGADVQWESPFGTMMPAYYAMHARAYMEKFSASREDLALVRLKAAEYGQLNPKAMFKKPLSMAQCLEAEPVSAPLGVFDCCANADGASCIIVASQEKARGLGVHDPVWILGVGAASAPLNLAGRSQFHGLAVAQRAAREAYEMAGIRARDVDLAEVHDCFTISELMAYEDLGFAEPGQGNRLIREGQTKLGGTIPVNLDGGLLSKGHPIGATGASQIRSIVLQLRGRAGEAQVDSPGIGLVHNIGGVGLYGNVTILGI